MSGGRRDSKSKGVVGDDAVEELLREAEDDLLLKLSVNTHTTSSSSALDPDLARRFEALKSPPSLPPRALHPAPSPSQPPPRSGGAHDEEMSRVLGDDLAARFAALKGPSAASSEPQSAGPVLRSDNSDDEDEDDDDEEDEDGVGVSKKEVEKVMQWAMDAARLDPSKSDDDNDEDDDEVDKEEELKQKAKEEGIKGKGKSKKWFFF